MFHSHRRWRFRCEGHEPNDSIDPDDQVVEVLCPLLMKQASSPLLHSQILSFRAIIHLSTTRSKWERDQLIAFFDEETVNSWKRADETYSDDWIDTFSQMKICLTRNLIVEAVDQIERYQKLALRTKATAAINALLCFCQEEPEESARSVTIRFYINAVWNTPLDTVEYFSSFSAVSQLVLLRIESRNSLEEKARETIDESDAMLFHQFLWVMWTSGVDHVDEMAIWEVAFKLIEICRSDKARFANAYFYAGNDWNKLVHDAVAKRKLGSGPLLDILLEGAPRKDEGYEMFVEKEFPFGPDSKVQWSTRKTVG